MNRPDGDLSGMTAEDVELACDWSGDEGALVAALLSVGFLDGEEGGYAIHDWAEHQPWSAGAEDRKQSSAWAALCKRYGRAGAAERMPEYAARMRKASDSDAEPVRPACDPHATRTPTACGTDAPLPSPSPSPSPTSKDHDLTVIANSPDGEPATNVIPADELEGRRKRTVIACPVARIADLWDEVLPELSSPVLWTDARKTHVSSRWREMAVHNGWKTQDEGIEWFRRTFVAIRGSPFLMGKTPPREKGKRPFKLTLDWMFGPQNFVKIVEGRYHAQG